MRWFTKKKDPLATIERIQALKVEKGDIVLVTVAPHASHNDMVAAQKIFLQAFGNIAATVLVVHKGTDVSLVSAANAVTDTSP